jgi:hypothetical protein
MDIPNRRRLSAAFRSASAAWPQASQAKSLPRRVPRGPQREQLWLVSCGCTISTAMPAMSATAECCADAKSRPPMGVEDHELLPSMRSALHRVSRPLGAGQFLTQGAETHAHGQCPGEAKRARSEDAARRN